MSDTYPPNRAGEATRRVDALKAENERLQAYADDRSAELMLRDGEMAATEELLADSRAEAKRLRTAIKSALSAMKADDRSNAECLNEAHAILSRVMADCNPEE